MRLQLQSTSDNTIETQLVSIFVDLNDNNQKLLIYLINDTKQTAECQEGTLYHDVTELHNEQFNLNLQHKTSNRIYFAYTATLT